jgi:cytochrome c553
LIAIMKLIRSTLAILVTFCFSNPSLAGEAQTSAFGKIFADSNCTWCHGPSGQGFSTAPRLAGQRPRYIENQLLSFRDRTRDNPLSQQYMWPAAASLGTRTMRDLATYFSSLHADPASDGIRRLADRGRKVYQGGIPAANIPSCAVCHGPDGEGTRQIPRLAGQSYYYLKRRLNQWGAGFHASAEPPMPGIAGKLSAADIEALSSYLSFVE